MSKSASAIKKIQEYAAFKDLPEQLQEAIKNYKEENTFGFIPGDDFSVHFFFDREQRKVTALHFTGVKYSEFDYTDLYFVGSMNDASVDAAKGVYCRNYHDSMQAIFEGKQEVDVSFGAKNKPDWMK